MIKHWSSEHEYFVQLMRSFVASEETPPDPPENLNWKRLQQILYRQPRTLQTLGPLIYQTSAPWNIKAEIGAAAKPLRARTRLILNEFPHLCDALRQAGVPTILLKGPALALTVYENSDSRLISDIDLLVAHEDLDRACDTIKVLGYERLENHRPEPFYEDYHFHRVFTNAEGIDVEMHWDLTVQADYVRFDLPQLFSRAQSTNDEDHDFDALDLSDALLHIVAQALPSFDETTAFDDAGRLIDACLLIKAGAASQIDVATRARTQGLATSLWIMLRLVEQVTGDPVSQAVKNAACPGFWRRLLITSLPIEDRMFGCSTESSGIARLILVLCCPNWRIACSRLGRFVFPNEEDLVHQGFTPGTISPGQRLSIAVRGMVSLMKMGAYMAWRLATRPWHRDR